MAWLEAVDAGRTNVHQDHVGVQFSGQADGFGPSCATVCLRASVRASCTIRYTVSSAPGHACRYSRDGEGGCQIGPHVPYPPLDMKPHGFL
jgi:hypothetical protein